MGAKFHFIPCVRQGIAGEISKTDTLGAGIAGTAQLSVRARVNDRKDSKKVNVRVHGPGDVTGINRLAIIRTDPAPWARDFEPNYFPIIDFDSPDFPWLFTPAKADNQGRLRPWLCLVVVRKQEGVALTRASGNALDVLSIKAPARPAVELPDLSESWAWAHAQATGSDQDKINDLLTKKPAQNLSRLICPRKLDPRQDYLAALVPAFEAGRKIGLGFTLQAADEQELKPAWLSGAAAPMEIELPVYYHWEFRTGERQDFFSLVQELEYRPLPDQVGKRNMAVQGLPFGLPDAGVLELEGALRPVKIRLPNSGSELGFLFDISAELQPDLDKGEMTEALASALALDLSEFATISIDTPGREWRLHGREKTYFLVRVQDRISLYEIPPAFTKRLREVLNIPAVQSAHADHDPIVGLPVYGSLHADQTFLPEVDTQPSWLNQLNLDPRQRVAAGLGTLVVQDQQEDLMEAAWAQLSEQRANQARNELQLGREASTAIFRKHLNAGADDDEKLNTLLRKAAPVFRKIHLSSEESAQIFSGKDPQAAAAGDQGKEGSLFDRLRQTAAPKGALSSAFRRVSRQKSPAAMGLRAKTKTDAWVTFLKSEKHPYEPSAQKRRGAFSMNDLKTRFTSSDFSPMLKFLENLQKKANQKQTAFAVLHDENLRSIGKKLLSELHPDNSFGERARAQEPVEPGSAPSSGDPLAPALAAPQYDYPMYRFLQDISQDFLLPGLEHIPDNTVTLLETNPEFIVSFMVGLNHEMCRELLWRDFPVNQRATFFMQFWDSRNAGPEGRQIDPINDWAPDTALGELLKTGELGEQLVILIRGELLRRFPSATVSAARFENVQLQSNTEVHPQFQGRMDPDVYFFGFPLREEDIRSESGWHFILQQQPTQPRFGLDVPPEGEGHYGKYPVNRAELSWGHVVSSAQEWELLSYVPITGRLKDRKIGNDFQWGFNSGHMAMLTLRKPVRIAIPASMILPAQAENN